MRKVRNFDLSIPAKLHITFALQAARLIETGAAQYLTDGQLQSIIQRNAGAGRIKLAEMARVG